MYLKTRKSSRNFLEIRWINRKIRSFNQEIRSNLPEIKFDQPEDPFNQPDNPLQMARKYGLIDMEIRHIDHKFR